MCHYSYYFSSMSEIVFHKSHNNLQWRLYVKCNGQKYEYKSQVGKYKKSTKNIGLKKPLES